MEVKVKAAVMEGPERIKIAYFPRPKVEEKASLLKVESTAICGTDLHRYWGTDRINFPVNAGPAPISVIAASTAVAILVMGEDLPQPS